jgi:predicted metal-dependent phosphoesterase TrpH
MKADLHAHTHFSRDALTSVETFARRYQQAGIDCVAVSDHNNIDGALAVREGAAFRVIVSEEIKSSEGEIIGLFLQETVRKGLTPEDTVRAIREQGGLVLVPHPYDRVRRSPLRPEALLRIMNDIDIIEVFNSRTVFAADNERSRRLAAEHGKLMSAATDAHTPWEIGLTYVDMPAFEGPRDFLVALGKGTITGRRSFIGFHFLSTWAKIRWRLHLGRRVAR